MIYNIKMRAEKEQEHISGAERIVAQDMLREAMLDLADRALGHPNGSPDTISVTIQKISQPVQTIPALRITECATRSPADARAVLEQELHRLGVCPQTILETFYQLSGMRGAALMDARRLCRLEPDSNRGIRATSMDYTGNRGGKKKHLKEALCLSSKVAGCPHIIGELCMSDDPDYTTGYFASRERGYMRLPHIKTKGDPRGGRIFLFQGTSEDVEACIRYLEETPVLVAMVSEE